MAVWRLRIMGALAVLIVLAVLAVLFWQSALLDIDKFKAEGNEHTPTEHIIAISGLRKGDQLLSLDLGAAEKSVERLPWVGTADIKRGWNGTITFRIEERQAVAVTFSRFGYALLDQEGRILENLGVGNDCKGFAQQNGSLLCLANLVISGRPGDTIPNRTISIANTASLLMAKKIPSADGGEESTFAAKISQIVIKQSDFSVYLELEAGGWIYLGDTSLRLEEKLDGALNILESSQLIDSGIRLCGNTILDVSIQNQATLNPDRNC